MPAQGRLRHAPHPEPTREQKRAAAVLFDDDMTARERLMFPTCPDDWCVTAAKSGDPLMELIAIYACACDPVAKTRRADEYAARMRAKTGGGMYGMLDADGVMEAATAAYAPWIHAEGRATVEHTARVALARSGVGAVGSVRNTVDDMDDDGLWHLDFHEDFDVRPGDVLVVGGERGHISVAVAEPSDIATMALRPTAVTDLPSGRDDDRLARMRFDRLQHVHASLADLPDFLLLP